MKSQSAITIQIRDYSKAPDGSLLIKKGDVWSITTYEELSKAERSKLKEIDLLKQDFENLASYTKHFKVYSKAHFIVVFNYFMTKVIIGDLDVDDEEILSLGDKVIIGEISVEDALEKHEFLKNTFESVFNEKETIEFPEV